VSYVCEAMARQRFPAELEGAGGADVRITRLTEDLLLVSLPEPARLAAAPGLTQAEVEVASLAAAGLSNASIARQRSAAARTIANQLASVYEKLGVRGRRELRAYLSRGEGKA
jgi:DNA-binding CsgD family transcriptional regulator